MMFWVPRIARRRKGQVEARAADGEFMGGEFAHDDRAILAQLRARGRVSRGYIGVGLRDVDGDLERSLKLTVSRGESCFLSAADGAVTASGQAVIFLAESGINC